MFHSSGASRCAVNIVRSVSAAAPGARSFMVVSDRSWRTGGCATGPGKIPSAAAYAKARKSSRAALIVRSFVNFLAWSFVNMSDTSGPSRQSPGQTVEHRQSRPIADSDTLMSIDMFAPPVIPAESGFHNPDRPNIAANLASRPD